MTDVRNDRDIDRARALPRSDEGSAPPPAATERKNSKDVAWDVTEKLLEEISYTASASPLAQGLHAADNVRTAATGGGDATLDRVRGVRLFSLVEKQLPPAHDRRGDERVGDYQLRPQVKTDAKGNDCGVEYYIAVRHGRAEFAIGTDALDEFKAHHQMYERRAAQSSGIEKSRPYEKDGYQTAELLRQGLVVEAAKQNLRAWDHAYRDPVWAFQQAVNLGAAMAPTAGAIHAMEATPTATEPAAPTLRRQYQPTTTADPSMPKGTGGTDKWGNVTYSSAGTATDVALVEAHESVHSFLSPKALNGLREFRADARMAAYQRSALFQYLEEALAESYAQAKVNGVASIPEGIRFPMRAGYVTLGRVITEAAIGTIAYGGVLYGVYVTVDE
jgi:hypothetical protein